MLAQSLLLTLVASTPSDFPPAKYVIQSREAQRVKGVLTLQVYCEKLRATEWVVFAAVAPELPGQAQVKTELEPAGKPARDRSPLVRSLLVAHVPARMAELQQTLAIRVVYEATLLSRSLEPLPPNARPARIPELPPASRKVFLAEQGEIDFKTTLFKKWLQEQKLMRGSRETDLDFARRVFGAISAGFSYEYAKGLDRRASAVCTAGRSDCGGLSNLFAAVLRANGIPARTLIGRWAVSATRPEGRGKTRSYQWHVKAEFFAEDVGWVPVDLARAVEHGASQERWKYFGHDPGDFLTFHLDTNLVLDTGLFGVKPLHNLQTPAWWVSGLGALDPRRTSEDWRVERLR